MAVANYTYDGDGLRASKHTTAGTEQFTWQVAGDRPLPLVDGTSLLIYGPDDLPIEQLDATATATYLVHDQLGSTRALLAQDGTVAATFTYDAFGNTTASTGTARTPIMFAGAVHDQETGFYQLINRYYDPATGQFLSVDPALALTQSPYSYAGDNAVNLTDPTGLWIPLIGAGIGAIVGGAIGGGNYLLNSLWFGNVPGGFTWSGLGGQTAGGITSGAISGLCLGLGPVAAVVCGIGAGAAGGAGGEAVNELTTQALAGKKSFDVNGGNVAEAGVFGALGGWLGGKLKFIGITRGPGTWPTKLSNIWNPGKIAGNTYKGNSATGAGAGLSQDAVDAAKRHLFPPC